MGLSTDHPLFIDISYVSAVILVGDLPPMSASLLMCGIAKKVLHLFFSLQGSSNNNVNNFPCLDCYFHANHERKE